MLFEADRIVSVFSLEQSYLGRIRSFLPQDVVESTGGQCEAVYTGPPEHATCAWQAYDDLYERFALCEDLVAGSCLDACIEDDATVVCP